MKRFNNVSELVKDSKIPQNVIDSTFAEYNEAAKTKKDKFGRLFFDHAPMRTDDVLHVAIVTPVVHYCMGGLRMSADSEVVNTVRFSFAFIRSEHRTHLPFVERCRHPRPLRRW